jgi:ribonuclease E
MKQILIDTNFGLVRTALAEELPSGNGLALLDYYEEPPEQGRTKGNIYKGTVKKVEGHLQAAFVKYGPGRDGFLPLRDSGKPPQAGDRILVQVVKDEVGDKGAALTTKMSLSGRYLVFLPGKDGDGGISSRLGDEDRAEMKKIMSQLRIPEGASIILRTAALHKEPEELQADVDRLAETWREIVDEAAGRKEPGLVFREAPPALRYLREYYTPDVAKIWVNQEEVLEECRRFFYVYEPKSAAKVMLSQDGPLMFHRLGVEAEVEKLSQRRVGLASGANIVIDQTEALVAIDVNSAKARPEGTSRGEGGRDEDHDLEDTVFAVNKEAAVEIARQLRLRDLGGIIIADFIDMEEEKHRRQVEEVMRKALAADKAKVKVFEISPLGIMQISRQRLRKAGPNLSKRPCETCQGRGWHVSPAAEALAALRRMEEKLHAKKTTLLMAAAPYPVANQLLNEFREHVVALEARHACVIRISATGAHDGETLITATGAAEAGKAAKPGRARAAAAASSPDAGEASPAVPKLPRGRSRSPRPGPAPQARPSRAPAKVSLPVKEREGKALAAMAAKSPGAEVTTPAPREEGVGERAGGGRGRRGRGGRSQSEAAGGREPAPRPQLEAARQQEASRRESSVRRVEVPAPAVPRQAPQTVPSQNGQPGKKRSRRRGGRGRGGRGGAKPPSLAGN